MIGQSPLVASFRSQKPAVGLWGCHDRRNLCDLSKRIHLDIVFDRTMGYRDNTFCNANINPDIISKRDLKPW
jgi:hypothetical protein